MMETHYNNPLSSADAVKSTNRQKADNSGLRLYYTTSLRKHDAGVLSIGTCVFVNIVMFLFLLAIVLNGKYFETRMTRYLLVHYRV